LLTVGVFLIIVCCEFALLSARQRSSRNDILAAEEKYGSGRGNDSRVRWQKAELIELVALALRSAWLRTMPTPDSSAMMVAASRWTRLAKGLS
jgi:hypothetical protein